MNGKKKVTPGAKLPSINPSGRTTTNKKQPENLVRHRTKPEYGARPHHTTSLADKTGTKGAVSRSLTVSGDQLTSPTPHGTGSKNLRPKPLNQHTSSHDMRPKLQFNGKMSLVCQIKMATLRREANLIKQTLPFTDDVV